MKPGYKPTAGPKHSRANRSTMRVLKTTKARAEQSSTDRFALPGDDGKRFVVRADEKLTAFLELESAIRVAAN